MEAMNTEIKANETEGIGAASKLSAVLCLTTLGCPFCGRSPKSVGRPTTPGEKEPGRAFFHFIACYCGGYSATAHITGYGDTPNAAELHATTRWNKRHNVEHNRRPQGVRVDGPVGPVAEG